MFDSRVMDGLPSQASRKVFSLLDYKRSQNFFSKIHSFIKTCRETADQVKT